MASVAIVTDSNSGLSCEEGQALGVTVVPMPVHINGEIRYEGRDITQQEFYAALKGGAEVATSQPAPGDVMDTWDRVLEAHDALVYIPMSGGLSGSCQTAVTLAGEYGGRVQVADNRRISVTQYRSVLEALAMAERGMDAPAIRRALEERARESSIYITVDTLKYLRRGGRVTGAEALAGTMLNIKPVLEIAAEKLTPVDKVRGMKAARQVMIDRTRADLEGRLRPLWEAGRLRIMAAHTQVPEETLADWQEQIRQAFSLEGPVYTQPLALSVACHIGPGALAIAMAEGEA